MIATSIGEKPGQAAVEDQIARVLVVVVVVDRHADVVQHARRPQQLALARVAVVQAQARELVEHAERERRDVLGVARRRAGSAPRGSARSRVARRRTAAGRRRPAGARRRPPRAAPPRWSRGRRSRPPRARPRTTTAPARIRSARAGLMPGTLARSAAGSGASRSISSSSAARSITIPCTPLDGRPAARWAAAARFRTVPPNPTSARAGRRSPLGEPRRACAARRPTCSRSSSQAPALGGPLPGRKRSVMRTVPRRQEPMSQRERDPRRARAASSRPRDPARSRRAASSSSRPRDSRSAPPRSRLSTLIGRPERSRAARGSSRRSRRRGSRSWRPRRSRSPARPLALQKCANTSSVVERPLASAPRRARPSAQALADAHRLVDLIGALPPALARP